MQIENEYLYVFFGLAVLTGLTVAFSFLNMGWLNLFTAILIAAFKAVLIAYFFMHIGQMEMVVKIFAGGSILWLSILLFYTFSDYVSRNWISSPSIWKQ